MPTPSSPSFRAALAELRGVVFDFDNVLVDSERHHYRAYREVFGKYGHALDEDEYWVHWTSRGEGPKGEIERHGLTLDPAAIRREKVPLYAEFCRSGEIGFYPEAVEVARLLHARGLPLAIASGSVSSDIRALLEPAGLETLFAAILGKDHGAREKPDPDIFLRAAEALGLPPERCIVFEDAEKGVAAARAASMRVAVVRTAYTRAIPFADADFVFEDHAAWLRAVREALGSHSSSPDSASPDSPASTAR